MSIKTTKQEVWIKIDGNYVERIKPQKIFLESRNRGHLKDGRRVRYDGFKWIYEPPKERWCSCPNPKTRGIGFNRCLSCGKIIRSKKK